MIVCLACFLSGSGLFAAENTFTLSPSLRIQEVTVPGLDTSKWPAGNWYPVPLKKYQALKNAVLLKKNTPPNSWLQEATYTATLKGDQLVDGRLEYVLHSSRNEPGFINLSKLNLAVHDLKWQTHAAVWGLAPDQKTMLLVDHFDQNLLGKWNLKGRQLPQRTEFSFRLPETVVSRVQLNVPRGMILTTSAGYVSGPSKSTLADHDLWQIELGGQSEFQAVIYQSDRGQQSPGQILYHQFAQVGIREDGLRLREDFQIEVLNRAVQKLEFEAPAEFEIYSVTLGNDLALPFEVQEKNGTKRITVDLIDPLLGISRPLSIRALASSSLEGDLVVPRLELNRAHFLGGTVHLDISAPLQTQKITATDLRQTGVLIQEEQGESYDFKQYTPDARLQYQLALPDLNLSARVHTLIQVEEKVWNLKSRIHWASAAGSTYRLETMIPTGWEITQVKSLSSDKNAGDLVWDVEQNNRQQKLSVRLPVSISPETPYSLEIQARRLFPALKRSFDLFGLKPVGCDNVNRILEITSSTEAGLQFEPDKEVEELTASELPRNWEYPVSDISGFYRLAPYSGSKWGTLSPSRGEQALQIATRTFVGIKDDLIQENYLLNCEPVRGGMNRVLVYLSESGDPVEWEVSSNNSSQSRLSSRKLPLAEHEKWELPQQGELWEIQFATPVFGELELQGSRSRSFQKNMKVALAYLPQALPFQGTVRVLNSNELNLRIQTEGLTATSESSSSTRLKRTQRNYEWEYRSPADTLTITRASELSDPGLENGTATIVIDTMFGHGDGEPDIHQATIDLDLSKSFDDKVQLRFPADVKLISTAVNQQRVTPIEAENHYLVPLFDQLDTYRITVQYQTVTASDQLSVSRQVPFPQINQRILETDWNFTLPKGEQLVSGPEEMVLQQVIPEGSVTRRLFGVLGKATVSEADAPVEWNAVVLFPVKIGSLRTSNLIRANIISWIVLLSTITLGLLLRIFRVGIRDKICITLVLISLVLAWIFPLPLAQIAGSCFAGILIVALIPRRFLRQEIVKQIEDQSTKAYEQPLSSIHSVAPILFFGLLVTSAVEIYAQNSTTKILPESSQTEQVKTELVLIPDSSESSTQPFVYLSPSLLKKLEVLSSSDQEPDYLISSARYAGTIQDNQLLTVKATFDVKISADMEIATISLPVSGGNLSGPESCRVDGKVVPVLLAADGQGILVEVQNSQVRQAGISTETSAPVEAQKPVLPFNYRDHEIELLLHPAVKFSASGGEFELGIPPLAINHFSFEGNDPLYLVELSETVGVSRYQLAGQKRFSSYLKESNLLKVKWLTSQNSETTPMNLEATAVANIDVSPSLIRTELRVKYKVLSGKVDYLFWELPPGMILRNVKSPGMTVVSAINPKANGRGQELLLELSESKTGEFEIEATFDLPSNDPMMTLNMLPVDIGLGPQGTPSKAIKVISYQAGVSTGPEFEIQQSGALPEGVLSISSKSSSKQLDESVLKSSALMFQFNQPAPVSLVLEAKNPKRSARINQTIVVNRKNIDWTFSAEMRISQAPAFRHNIRVPQGLRIESLSVKEDDVERLAHWHRTGNQITLFLKNKTTGLQDLTLKGWLPIRKLGSLKLPLIQLEGVDTEESILSLYRKPQIEVQLTSPQFQRIQESTASSAIADHISFVGKYREIDSENQPITLLVNLQKSSIAADTLTVIESVEEHQIEVAQSFRISSLPADAKKLFLRIPHEYEKQYSIDGMPFEALEEMADGFQLVELQPASSVSKEFTVTVRGKLTKPTGEFSIPAVILENSVLQKNYLLLSNSQTFQLADKKSRQTLLQKENVPAWVQARCDASEDLDSRRVYSTDQLPWKMVTTSRTASALNREFIPYLETEVILSDQGAVYGLTQIKLFNQNRRELLLNWPEKSKLMAVLINGENDGTLKPDSGQLRVPLNGRSQFNEITLFWETYQIEHQYLLEKASIVVPLPVEIPFDKNLIKIITSDGHRTYLSDYVSPFTYFADKLEEQLKIAELELEWGDASQVSRTTWTAIAREFTQLELILAEPNENGEQGNQELTRFNELKDRVFEVRNNVDPEENPVREIRSFVHDFQRKLGPLPVQKIRYYSSSGDGDRKTATLFAWIVPNLYLNVLLASFALLILLPVLGRWVHSRSADWLSSQPAVGLVILGTLWLLCFSPAAVGLIFIALAAVVEFKNRQTSPANQIQPEASSPGTPSVSESFQPKV